MNLNKQKKNIEEQNDILFFENLRFWPEEEKNDEKNDEKTENKKNESGKNKNSH